MKIATACWVAVAAVLASCPHVASRQGLASGPQWIWTDDGGTPNVWAVFRKEFILDSLPSEALARIAADSKYWLWVNDELVVFEGALKRGPRPDGTWVDEIDLAPHLQIGGNCVAVLVWYWGKEGFSHVDSGSGGFIFDAEVGVESIVSAADWKAVRHSAYLPTTDGPQPSSILPEHNIRFDARLDDLGDWKQVGYDDFHWPAAVSRGEPPVSPWGVLVERSVPMVRFSDIREFVESTVTELDDGRTGMIARLPYNAQVTAWFEVEAPAGLVIDMRTDNYQIDSRYSVRTEYVTRSGVQSFESLGWFNGDEIRFTVPEGVEVRRLGYRESGFDTQFRGSFVSDDPYLDLLWVKASRTTYLNMRDTFMDCPDRERAQWWGDVVNEMVQAFYAFDPAVHSLARKAICDLLEWRKDGVILHSPVPAGNFDRELPIQMLASVGRFGFWQYFLHTGEVATITDAFEPVLQYLDLWQEDPTGLVVHRQGDWDWVDWGRNTDPPVIENAWFAMALQGAIKMSVVAGKPDAKIELEARLDRLRGGFDASFWTGMDYRSADHTGPTDDRANALAVLAGFAPEERWPALRSVLVAEYHASPFMERFVLEALFQMEYAEEALTRMEARFGPMVSDATTTLWEYWDRDAGSDNHGWSGGPLYLLSSYVAGIAPEAPGWIRYRVKPQLARLRHVSCAVTSIQGPIHVTHQRSDAEHRTDLQSPSGTTATVGIPVLSLGGMPVLEVRVNGRVAWDESGSHTIPGITFVGSSSSHLSFEVDPGNWSFVARANPAVIFGDGFENGDTMAWQ